MEQHAEVAVARAPDSMRDFGDGQVRLAEQVLRALDAALEPVAVRKACERCDGLIASVRARHASETSSRKCESM